MAGCPPTGAEAFLGRRRTPYPFDRAQRRARAKAWKQGHLKPGALQEIDPTDRLFGEFDQTHEHPAIPEVDHQRRPMGRLSTQRPRKRESCQAQEQEHDRPPDALL